MQGNRRRDTRPELELRSQLHALGLRFRVDFPPLAGVRNRADIVFTRAKLVVFVDGCFWHGCPTHFVIPKTNRDYWIAKIRRNQERDRSTDEVLRAAGWMVIRIWEHESLNDSVERIVETWRRRLGRSV